MNLKIQDIMTHTEGNTGLLFFLVTNRRLYKKNYKIKKNKKRKRKRRTEEVNGYRIYFIYSLI